ncbi:MAG TPA: hypothetical protein VHU86_12105 [Solirubrobacterales bacterium]|jgi:hypothetical protein|nr:hypothetical protein [Solirubrobacterales bacterium]
MYFIPLIVLIVIALIATAWTPIFGVIIFVVGFVLFLAYVGFSRRSDQEVAPPQPGAEVSPATVENEAEGGLWGERNPDKEGALHKEGS